VGGEGAFHAGRCLDHDRGLELIAIGLLEQSESAAEHPRRERGGRRCKQAG
jgi:hypothetical protein